ncbi:MULTISPECIES: heavy-metal-associated domain-containing protein [Streptomyces]|uniref:heavy-metal-associated domain-containing protein n=1 Tax=Streptomyces TaxID=1883 RepID=UPI00081EF97F|nr:MULTISPECIES: heavy-metal-associated domain-containing protein [Streptomyces]MCQ1581489.1 heavy-metal-associated domain-containing protein [Streptomyces parvus]OSC76355.1 transporter [Streptomyces sp. BF-3]UCA50551.1 heavy-metal-associated domain-containing protein [Streptomyces sp. WA6-1-16]SCF58622.1 Copper chaperone CopZ [Streptomyces sp. Cmuel-A718b]
MNENHYRVAGMTCGHCVASVAEEVAEVPGVHDVTVDLPEGTVLVRGRDLDDALIRTAIAEAGYTVTEPVAV